MVLGPAQPIRVGSCPKQDPKARGVAFFAKSLWVWLGSGPNAQTRPKTLSKIAKALGPASQQH